MENFNPINSRCSNNYCTKNINNLPHFKNMFGIIIFFCDLKTIFILFKVNKKFREILKNEKIVPIFSYYIEGCTIQTELFNISEKLVIFDQKRNNLHLNKLGDKLRENHQYRSYSQEDHLMTWILRYNIKKLLSSVEEELNCSDTEIGENYETFKIFCEELAENTKTTKLLLYKNSIGFYPECMQVFCEALKINTTMFSLDLTKNFIGKYLKSMNFLSELIYVNKTITMLNLCENSIGINLISMSNFSEAIKYNKTITTLNLNNNSIGINKKSMIVFFEAININKTISRLYLGNNSIEYDEKKLINSRKDFDVYF